ncbi:unnamed protein product [Ambrosiozyma monospora]|uniref:Unnamed protein product n=1 Tax=Ambrosiozyma monospora TaxID=43982 RepID=A0ACB5T1E5_AMBMO|nr:unnamed protein product [Ambrosiozyma monospora]
MSPIYTQSNSKSKITIQTCLPKLQEFSDPIREFIKMIVLYPIILISVIKHPFEIFAYEHKLKDRTTDASVEDALVPTPGVLDGQSLSADMLRTLSCETLCVQKPSVVPPSLSGKPPMRSKPIGSHKRSHSIRSNRSAYSTHSNTSSRSTQSTTYGTRRRITNYNMITDSLTTFSSFGNCISGKDISNCYGEKEDLEVLAANLKSIIVLKEEEELLKKKNSCLLPKKKHKLFGDFTGGSVKKCCKKFGKALKRVFKFF